VRLGLSNGHGCNRRRPALHRHPGQGTSAATPFWAGIIDLADRYAGRHLGFINDAVYRIGRSAFYHKAFHDVTAGNTDASGL